MWFYCYFLKYNFTYKSNTLLLLYNILSKHNLYSTLMVLLLYSNTMVLVLRVRHYLYSITFRPQHILYSKILLLLIRVKVWFYTYELNITFTSVNFSMLSYITMLTKVPLLPQGCGNFTPS